MTADPFASPHAADHPLGRQLLELIEADIIGQPRSQQRLIGPSELGDPCDRCLTRKLLGIPERQEAAWLPYVGTAMHAQLAGVLRGQRGYIVEQRVKVGSIAGQGIVGTFDLYSRDARTVVDYKVVGVGTLRKVRAHGASQTYRVQAHAYGRGVARDLGMPVDRVAVLYLPRNMPELREAALWWEPYDEQVVVDALARCERLLAAARPEGQTGDPSPAWLATLDVAPDCYSCPRYEEAA